MYVQGARVKNKMTTYKSIGDDGKNNVWIRDGFLYVKQTNTCYGMLEQGGRSGRVYRVPYKGTLADAQVTNDWGVSDINRAIENGTVIRKGSLIQ